MRDGKRMNYRGKKGIWIRPLLLDFFIQDFTSIFFFPIFLISATPLIN
jgi:hypothetical protein